MPRNNKKKGQKDTKDPIKLKVLFLHLSIRITIYNVKELGNKAFQNKNYPEALDFYSKAIEEDPTDPVFYSNSKMIFLIKYFDQEVLYIMKQKNSMNVFKTVIKLLSLIKVFLKQVLIFDIIT